MVNDETDGDHGAELRRKQAQAMLDLFEADHQRPAATLEELREWASSQDQEQLQLRVDHYLDYESELRRTGCRVRPVSPSLVPGMHACSEDALGRRNRDAAAFALEAEIANVIREAKLAADDALKYAAQTSRRRWWIRLVK